MVVLQYVLVGITALAALLWLFRKNIFPSKKSNGCGDSDCGCH